MKRRTIRIICLIILFHLYIIFLVLCSVKVFTSSNSCLRNRFDSCLDKMIVTFDERCYINEEGFNYYVPIGNSEVHILDIPATEELIIPEYIDGKKVVDLGYYYAGLGYSHKYYVFGNNTKKLTIQHQFNAIKDYEAIVNFPHLLDLIIEDFLYFNQNYSNEELLVPYYIGKKTSNVLKVELKKTE